MRLRDTDSPWSRADIVALISSGSLTSELWSDKRVSVVKRSSSRCEINQSVHQSTIFARTAKRRALFLISSRSPDSDSVIFRHSTPRRRTDRPTDRKACRACARRDDEHIRLRWHYWHIPLTRSRQSTGRISQNAAMTPWYLLFVCASGTPWYVYLRDFKQTLKYYNYLLILINSWSLAVFKRSLKAYIFTQSFHRLLSSHFCHYLRPRFRDSATFVQCPWSDPSLNNT